MNTNFCSLWGLTRSGIEPEFTVLVAVTLYTRPLMVPTFMQGSGKKEQKNATWVAQIHRSQILEIDYWINFAGRA